MPLFECTPDVLGSTKDLDSRSMSVLGVFHIGSKFSFFLSNHVYAVHAHEQELL